MVQDRGHAMAERVDAQEGEIDAAELWAGHFFGQGRGGLVVSVGGAYKRRMSMLFGIIIRIISPAL